MERHKVDVEKKDGVQQQDPSGAQLLADQQGARGVRCPDDPYRANCRRQKGDGRGNGNGDGAHNDDGQEAVAKDAQRLGGAFGSVFLFV